MEEKELGSRHRVSDTHSRSIAIDAGNQIGEEYLKVQCYRRRKSSDELPRAEFPRNQHLSRRSRSRIMHDARSRGNGTTITCIRAYTCAHSLYIITVGRVLIVKMNARR